MTWTQGLVIIGLLLVIVIYLADIHKMIRNYVNAEYVDDADKEEPLAIMPIGKPSNAYKNNELFKKE